MNRNRKKKYMGIKIKHFKKQIELDVVCMTLKIIQLF